MASTQRGERLTISYQAIVATLGERLGRILLQAWTQVQGNDELSVRRWLAAVVPAVLAGQARAVAVTDAYLAAFVAAEGTPVGVVGLDARRFTGAALRGVTIETVYRRPLLEATKSSSLSAGLAGQRGRVEANALTDVQLAARAARAGWAERVPQVRGWRRALGSGKHCALCSSLSGHVFSRQMLMPIHNHCKCVAEPVLLNERPQRPMPAPQVNDSPGLQAAEMAGEAIARVESHGELGPVLVAVGNEFSREG